jgi:hypothetical protein
MAQTQPRPSPADITRIQHKTLAMTTLTRIGRYTAADLASGHPSVQHADQILLEAAAYLKQAVAAAMDDECDARHGPRDETAAGQLAAVPLRFLAGLAAHSARRSDHPLQGVGVPQHHDPGRGRSEHALVRLAGQQPDPRAARHAQDHQVSGQVGVGVAVLVRVRGRHRPWRVVPPVGLVAVRHYRRGTVRHPITVGGRAGSPGTGTGLRSGPPRSAVRVRG